MEGYASYSVLQLHAYIDAHFVSGSGTAVQDVVHSLHHRVVHSGDLGVPAWALVPFRPISANWDHVSSLGLLKFQQCEFLKMYSRLRHVAWTTVGPLR